MLLNMIDSKIGPLLVLYHRKAHTTFEDGSLSINKRSGGNWADTNKACLLQRKGNSW